MKRTLAAAALLCGSGSALAAPAFQPSGPNLTYGDISNRQTIMGNITNPAAGAVGRENGERSFGFGLLSSVGVGYEVGPVGDLADRVDQLADDLDRDNLTFQDAVEIKNDFDQFLIDAGADGYIRAQAAAHIPLMPLYFTGDWMNGAIVIDANVSGQGQGSVIDAPLQFNPVSQQVETSSAVYIKGAVQQEASLGYSTQLWQQPVGGALYAGLRLRYLRLGLRKTLVGMEQLEDDAATTIEEEAQKQLDYQTNFGLDAGLLWVADNYRLGLTFMNLNEPAFDYEAVGQNCAAGDDACFLAQAHSDEIALKETHTKDRQAKLEATVYSDSRNFFLAGAVDSNPVRGPVGNEIQWATASTGYATNSWWIPGIRVGYRKNLAGTQLSMVTAGLTLFKTINVDAAYGLESTQYDGQSIPRTAMVNVGLELSF
jgi:hypothetical protein